MIQTPGGGAGRGSNAMQQAAARAVMQSALQDVPGVFGMPPRLIMPRLRLSRKDQEEVAKKKTELVEKLTKMGVDPLLFDSLLTNEMNRKLKTGFGKVFLGLTVLFTIASYAVVILNSVYAWGVSDVAITALIIEIPIQFVGLLYVIARNLFPESAGAGKP